MGVGKTLLRPVASAAGWYASRQVRAFLSAHRRTRDVQDRLLRRLLAASADSAFGRDHGLGRVRTYDDFVSAVPVGDYETHRPYVDRLLAGDDQALFGPGTRVLMFAVTSGTTGAPKHIPVTARFLREYRRGWNIFGVRALRDHPAGWLRGIVTIASSARESYSAGGIPCGAISGLLSERQMWIVRQMYPVPPAAANIPDPASKYYTIVRSSIAHDIALVATANPSALIKLGETARDHAERLIRDVRDGTLHPPGDMPGALLSSLRFRPNRRAARRLEAVLDRHGELTPKHFWNLAFISHWTGGTVGLYLPQVRRLYGEAVPIRDIGLLASEGRLSIPLADGTPAGAAEITSNFLEFIPAEQIESDAPDVLRAHEVACGREYFVVLSNWAGLWRYHINDRVRVTERIGDTPVIEFLSKGLHTCSITGEKLTEHQVVAAMARAAAAMGADVDTFVLQGHFAHTPYYALRLADGNGCDADALAAAMDRALCGLNVEYDGKRRSGRLGPIRATAPDGDLAAAARQARAEQYKHTYLLTQVVNDNG